MEAGALPALSREVSRRLWDPMGGARPGESDLRSLLLMGQVTSPWILSLIFCKMGTLLCSLESWMESVQGKYKALTKGK